VELTNFPAWTELEDLKAVVDFTGNGDAEVTVRRNKSNPNGSVAVAIFGTAAAAAAAAAQLHGFEFTPGYPLEAKAVAAKLPPMQGGPKGAPKGAAPALMSAKGAGKTAGKKVSAIDEGTVEKSDYPVANCVGAGLIEGWFAVSKGSVDERGWGHVQSYSFEGNLSYRPIYCPQLYEGEIDYKPKDPVTFEVVQAADGRFLAVHLCMPGQVPHEAGLGETPWTNRAVYLTDCFVDENRRWLQQEGEVLLKSFDECDREFVIASGPLTGCRDPRKVMFSRINNARLAAGMPYVQCKKREEYTEEEWSAWNNGDMLKRGQKRPVAPGEGGARDMTWGNDEGCGVFFAGLTSDIDELSLQAYAENAGIVTFVKIFKEFDSGEHKGCGKVFYSDAEQAQHAIATLHKTELNGKLLTVQILGDETRRKKRRPDEQGGRNSADFEEGPKLLPLSYFDGHDTDEQKMELCYAAFEDLLENHDAEATGKGVVWMVRSLVREINQVFEGNNEAKQAFAWRLGKHPWFRENEQQVKWQVSRALIQISKVSALTMQWKQEKGKGKGEEKGQGNPYQQQQQQQQQWR